MFYDEQARPIQVVTSRPQAGGTYTQRRTSQYAFSGEVLLAVTTTTGPHHPPVVLTGPGAPAGDARV